MSLCPSCGQDRPEGVHICVHCDKEISEAMKEEIDIRAGQGRLYYKDEEDDEVTQLKGVIDSRNGQIDDMQEIIHAQKEEIAMLKRKIEDMEATLKIVLGDWLRDQK